MQLFLEPGLFQWLRWCKNGVPKFMGIIELAEAGFPVSRIYKPHFDAQRFNLHETLEEYFERSYALIKCILERHFQGNRLINDALHYKILKNSLYPHL